MRRLLDELAVSLPPDAAGLARSIGDDDPHRSDAAVRTLCDEMYARALRALLRDSISPDVIHAGIKYNVIPGVATIEIDCRTLPGTTEGDMREEVDGPPGRPRPALHGGAPHRSTAGRGARERRPVRHPRGHHPRPRSGRHPVAVMAPFATDAKSTVKLGVPTYGFSPLRLEPGERFLERFHGTDERVGVEALRWGLPVLYDVVLRYCG